MRRCLPVPVADGGDERRGNVEHDPEHADEPHHGLELPTETSQQSQRHKRTPSEGNHGHHVREGKRQHNCHAGDDERHPVTLPHLRERHEESETRLHVTSLH